MPVYLDVPFRDKDIVKALGARWDGKERKWFVPEYQDRAKFERWVSKPAEGAADDEDVPVDDEAGVGMVAFGAGDKSSATLGTVLFEISEAIRKSQPVPRWISAEVANLKTTANGHCYMDLVEHDQSGREIAKASGRIWSTAGRILKKFEKETGSKLAAGMKIRFLAKPDFSIQYGFGLTIEDIDSSWTLGEMERKLLELRERLKTEGLFGKNAGRAFPGDFTKVLVLSPDGAAGLGDFMSDAVVLESAGLCEFHMLTAVFEGVSSSMSICGALSRAAEMCAASKFDVLVVIRGGGAKTSLHWLNDYDMARLIADFPVPVLTGIGHERDSVILDDVAAKSFDTPSKAIGFIVGVVVGNAKQAMEDMANIRAEVSDMLSQAAEGAEGAMSEVASLAAGALEKASSGTAAMMAEIRAQARGLAEVAASEVDGMFKELVGMGPGSTLARGYAIVKGPGGVVSTSKGLKRGRIGVTFSDGEVICEIGKIERTEKND